MKPGVGVAEAVASDYSVGSFRAPPTCRGPAHPSGVILLRPNRGSTRGYTGSITAAYKAIKKAYPNKSIEIEVDSLEQFTEALTLKPDLILLDNMSVEMCQQAVEQNKGSVKLEASGGLSLKNAKAYANTGVDYLAVGALTHSAPALDIGLDFRKDK